VKKSAIVVVMALAVGTAACSKGSDKASKATATTASSAPAATPTSAASASGPVTDADITEVDQILHRLDTELDRLDSDMATGEGEVQ
jgi:hypothetical protein